MNTCSVDVFLPLPPPQIVKLVEDSLLNPKSSTCYKVLLLIDECFLLARNPKHSSAQRFEVGRNWFEKRISRVRLQDGQRVRASKLLYELGLIQETSPHRAEISPRANTYRMKHSTYRKYRIDCPVSLVQKIANLKKARPSDSDERLAWVEESLRRCSLPASELKRLVESRRHKSNAIRFIDQKMRVTRSRGIYISHPGSSLPRRARERLLFDGECPVSRLDISSAHPLMTCWLANDMIVELESRGQASGKIVPELNSLRAFLSEPDFYGRLLPGENKKVAKKAFLRALNGSDGPAANRAFGRFRSRFPSIGILLANRQRKNPTAFSDELQGRVTEIILFVIEKCRNEGIPCVPVTDELIVPLNERMKVRKWLCAEIKKRTGVDARVG